jgi:hypothetical protein
MALGMASKKSTSSVPNWERRNGERGTTVVGCADALLDEMSLMLARIAAREAPAEAHVEAAPPNPSPPSDIHSSAHLFRRKPGSRRQGPKK